MAGEAKYAFVSNNRFELCFHRQTTGRLKKIRPQKHIPDIGCPACAARDIQEVDLADIIHCNCRADQTVDGRTKWKFL